MDDDTDGLRDRGPTRPSRRALLGLAGGVLAAGAAAAWALTGDSGTSTPASSRATTTTTPLGLKVTTDGSRSAQFEHTLVVTDDGAEILTLTGDGSCAADRVDA